MPSMTSSRASTVAPMLAASVTLRPSRAASIIASLISATDSG